MAITSAAKKSLRQSIKRKARNVKKKTKLRNLLKEVRSLIAQKKLGEAKKLLPQVYKFLDKAAKGGKLIKKNTASRTKSRITKSLNLGQK